MTMFHRDLALHKDVTAPEVFMLQFKVTSQLIIWSLKLKAKADKEAIASGRDLAEQVTIEAAARIANLERILSQGLARDPKVVWSDLLQNEKFRAEPFRLSKPTLQLEPQPTFVEPRISLWSRLTGNAPRLRSQAEKHHADRLAGWSREEEARKSKYGEQLQGWNAAKGQHETRVDNERRRFESEQSESNQRVYVLEQGVQTGKAEAIQEQMSIVLEKSNYEGLYEKLFVLEYVAETKTLMIEYSLPSPDAMPTLKVARFIAKTGG
jgi:restriction system protein